MAKVPHMAYTDPSGEVFDHPKLSMAVFDGYQVREPLPEELIPLPPGSDFFQLPGRLPLGFSGKKRAKHLTELEGSVSAVSAFIAPAYLRLTHPAYRSLPDARTLPLFAYAPLGWADGIFWTTGLRIDPETRQDPDTFDESRIAAGVTRDLRQYPRNRLLLQLRRCALEYGCRAAQNFFLKRFEAPLPTSNVCNSACLGCISKQEGDIPVTQERLEVTPSAREVSEVALIHAGRVTHSIASFGQGCEGEPLMRANILLDAVQRVRKESADITMNLNTNASKPEAVEQLMAAGLSSIRVSLASPTPELYNRYHRPANYTFDHVCQSMRAVKKHGGFISLNLLVFPGLTDRADEIESLCRLLDEYQVDMIQWRNLNIDPEYYLAEMGHGESGPGLLATVRTVQERFPQLRHGYFNPYLSTGEAP